MVSLVHKIVDFSHILNAQLRLRGKARAPFSVRVRGRVQLSGDGEVVLGEGVSLNGTVVPIELVTYSSGRIEIGNHTFINYGSSIAARASVQIGHSCHLGHYTFVMDNDQHDTVRHMELPQSVPVVIEDHVWIGSKTVILAGVRVGSRAVSFTRSWTNRSIRPVSDRRMALARSRTAVSSVGRASSSAYPRRVVSGAANSCAMTEVSST